MSIIEVAMPEIGDAKDVPVVEIAVRIGDLVAEGDTVVALETDKATLDVPSATAGRVRELRVAVGDGVSMGSVLLVLEAGLMGLRSNFPPPFSNLRAPQHNRSESS